MKILRSAATVSELVNGLDQNTVKQLGKSKGIGSLFAKDYLARFEENGTKKVAIVTLNFFEQITRFFGSHANTFLENLENDLKISDFSITNTSFRERINEIWEKRFHGHILRDIPVTPLEVKKGGSKKTQELETQPSQELEQPHKEKADEKTENKKVLVSTSLIDSEQNLPLLQAPPNKFLLSLDEIRRQLSSSDYSDEAMKTWEYDIAHLPDADFIQLTFELLAKDNIEQTVQAFFALDQIRARTFSPLSTGKEIVDALKATLAWMENNPKRLSEKGVQTGLSNVLVQLFLAIHYMDSGKKNDVQQMWKDGFSKNRQNRLLEALPLALKYCVLNVTQQLEEQSLFSSSFSPTLISKEEREKKARNTAGITESKILSIDVADQIEGYDFRTMGIRFRVHQRPGPDTIAYIRKYIDSFYSGRRNFIFEGVPKVPMSNYKGVMKYVISSLKEDREKYYQKHPGYLNQLAYTEAVKDIQQKDISGLPELFRFEFIAQKLIALEEGVLKAETDSEIGAVLKEFRELYQYIPNFNLNLTICTGLSIHAFQPEGNLQPVIVSQVPQKLNALADLLNDATDDMSRRILNALYVLSDGVKEVPEQLQNTILNLYNKWKESTDGPELAESIYKPLLNALKQVSYSSTDCLDFVLLEHAMKEALGIFDYRLDQLKESIKKENEKHKFRTVKIDCEELKKQISAIPRDNQVSLIEGMKKLSEVMKKKFEENPKAYKAHKESFDYYTGLLSPQVNWEGVTECQIDVEEIKEQWPKSTPEELQRLIKDLGAQFPEREYFGEGDHVDKSEPKPLSLAQLEDVFKASQALKSYILNTLMPKIKEEQVEQASLILHLLGQLEEQIALQAVDMEGSKEPERVLKFVTGIAVSHSYLERPFEGNLEALKAEMKEKRELMADSYQSAKVKLRNVRPFQSEKDTQLIMGLMNTGLLGAVSRMVEKLDHEHFSLQKLSETHLSGQANMSTVVEGTVRVIQDLSQLKEANPGDILVIPTLPPYVHKYAKATAIVSEAGGIFSHGALDLRDMNIPALIGSMGVLQKLNKLDGQPIQLKLSTDPDGKNEFSVLKEFKPKRLEKIALPKNIKSFDVPSRGKPSIEGKARNLVALSKVIPQKIEYGVLDVSIPPFIVLESDFSKKYFEQIVGEKTLKEQISALLKTEMGAEEKSQAILKLMEQVNPSEGLLELLKEQFSVFQKNAKEGSSFIVRSSGALEDSKKISLAGLLDSVPNLKSQDEYIKAVQTVWKSAFSPQAIEMLSRYRVDISKFFETSIVVQEYVSTGDFSGVAFSKVPEKGNLVGIQVVEGLGGGVDGKQNPTMIFVKRGNHEDLIEEVITGSEGKTYLSVHALKDLSRLMKDLERNYGYPIDAEFVACAKKDSSRVELSLVQLRPITGAVLN